MPRTLRPGNQTVRPSLHADTWCQATSRVALTPPAPSPHPPHAASPKPIALKKYPFKDFHPHGVDILQKDGRTLLYAVNHRREGEVIDVFELDAAAPAAVTATYVATITDALFLNLNDVAMLSEDEFYVANWLRYEPGTLDNMFETVLQKAVSYVVHCKRGGSGQPFHCHKAASNLAVRGRGTGPGAGPKKASSPGGVLPNLIPHGPLRLAVLRWPTASPLMPCETSSMSLRPSQRWCTSTRP